MKQEFEEIKARGVNNLFRDKKTGIIYFRRYRKGKGEIKKSLKTTLLEVAKERSEILWREFSEADTTVNSKRRELASELFERWVNRRINLNKRDATITSIRQSQKFFNLYFDQMHIEDITAQWWEDVFIPGTRYKRCIGVRRKGELVREWKDDREESRRFFNDRKWLKSFLNQCVEDGLRTKSPKLANIDPDDIAGKVFKDKEVTELIRLGWDNIKMFVLMASTMGMRRSEITRLRKDRIDLANKTIGLKASDTKTKKPRTFAVSPEVWPLLLKQLEAHPDSPFVFPGKKPGQPTQGFAKAWKSLKRMAGVEGRFHDLRHTFLTKAFKTPGSNPLLICKYAGLTMEVAEKVYLHVDANDTKGVSLIVSFKTEKRDSETDSETRD